MIELKEFVREDGTSPFGQWFDRLNIHAATQITVALTRLKEGKHSRVKPVGRGIYEYTIDFGPGYRIYFGKDGEKIIILLYGGHKKNSKKISIRPTSIGKIIKKEK
ncbi:MAG TPA: type II toxin-antitoxin system RelE/ParE family toxin [Nitrospirota bacterium]|nr:type II toxin-antitoxin system RelE/ParE family toxin [Nitrospirota bacterium]